MNFLKKLKFLIKFTILKIIKFYQKTISPDHGGILTYLKTTPTCKYQPTCSQYAYQAFKKYGILKASFLTIKRLIKCNPFSKGGWDPLN